MTITSSHSPAPAPALDVRVGPHGYSHGWVKGDVLDGSWKLTGIQHDKGQCDHCGRDLGKVFQVVHPSGRTANLGSTHAAKATGFNKVQQAADAAAALEEKQKQRVESEKKLRDSGEGDLIDRLQARPQTVDVGGSTMASSAHVVLNQLLDGIISPEQAREEVNQRSRDEELEKRKAWGRDLKVHKTPEQMMADKKAALEKKTAEFAKISDKDAHEAAKTWTESFRHTGSGTDKDFSDELKRSQTGKGEAKTTPGAKKAHHFLRAVHERSTKQSGSLHRGMALTPAQLKKFGEGKHVDIPVSSWSKDQAQAQRFGYDRGAKKGVVLHTASGAKGWDISKHSASGVEKEVVTGGRFHVDRVVGNHVYLSQTAMHARADRHVPDWFPSDFSVDDDVQEAFDETHPLTSTGAPDRVTKASISPLQSRDWATWDLEHEAEGKKLSPADYDKALQHHFQQGLKLAQTETHRGNLAESTRRTLADMHSALAVSHEHHGKGLLAAHHRGLAAGYSQTPFAPTAMHEKPMEQIKAGLVQKSLSKANTHNARRILAGNPHFATVRWEPFEIEFRDYSGGHHVPGTPFHFKHGWIPLDAFAEAQLAKKEIPSGHREAYKTAATAGYSHAAHEHLDSVQIAAKAAPYYAKAKKAHATGDFQRAAEALGTAHGIMEASRDKKSHEKDLGVTPHKKQAVGKGGAKKGSVSKPTPPEPKPPVIVKPTTSTSGKTPADETKYMKGSPKYKAFNEGHAEAVKKAQSENMTAAEARTRAEFQHGQAREFPTAKGDTRKADAEGRAAGYEAHAAAGTTKPTPTPTPVKKTVSPAPSNPFPEGSAEHAQYAAGYSAHKAGQDRVVPRDVLVNHGADAARAWYKGWDTHNLETPKPSNNNPNPLGGVRAGGVSRVDPKTGITYTYHEDNKGFDDHSVFVQAHKDGKVLGDTNGHPRYGHLNVNGPVVSIWKYQVAEDGRRQGIAKQMIQTIHENNAGAKITHSGFVSAEGEKFADSLDPKFNRIMPPGERRFRPTKGSAAAKPSVSRAPPKPYVYDNKKGADENHTLLTAHIRESIKAQGIKARVNKQAGSAKAINIETPTFESSFTHAEQKKILQIGLDNGLTHAMGTPIDVNGPDVHSKGTTFYIGPQAKPAPSRLDPKVEDLVAGQPLNNPNGEPMRVVSNEKLRSGGHIVTVKSAGGETSMAHAPDALASDVVTKHLNRLKEREPAPTPAPGNHYNVGSAEHNAYNEGHQGADEWIGRKKSNGGMGLEQAQALANQENGIVELLGDRIIKSVQSGDEQAAQADRVDMAEHEGRAYRYEQHIQDIGSQEVNKTNVYKPGTPEHNAFQNGHDATKNVAAMADVPSSSAREMAETWRQTAARSIPGTERAEAEGKAAGLEAHAVEKQATEAPIKPESRAEAISLLAQTPGFTDLQHNQAMVSAIKHLRNGAPSRQEFGLTMLDKAERATKASMTGYRNGSIASITSSYQRMRDAIKASKPGEKISPDVHNPQLLAKINQGMASVDEANGRLGDARKVEDFMSQLGHAVAHGEASPAAPNLSDTYRHAPARGGAVIDSYSPEHIATMRQIMEDAVANPDKGISEFGGTTVRDLQDHAEVMAKGQELTSRIDQRPEVAGARQSYEVATRQAEAERVKMEAAQAQLVQPEDPGFNSSLEARAVYREQMSVYREALHQTSIEFKAAQVDQSHAAAAYSEALRVASIEELGKERSIGGGADTHLITAKGKYGRPDDVKKIAKPDKLIRQAMAIYPSDWIAQSHAKGGVSIFAGRAPSRASYSPDYKTLNISKTVIHTTAVHELGHHMENTVPGIKRMEHAHLISRSAGEHSKSLRSIQPEIGYGSSESAREDKFVDPYVGKDYSQRGPGPTVSHEILTVGVQSVFGKPETGASTRQIFGRLVGMDGHIEDQGLRQFVLGTMSTVGRPLSAVATKNGMKMQANP